VVNKIDLGGVAEGVLVRARGPEIHLSARTGAGVPALRAWLLETAGWKPHGEGVFLARARHLEALLEAQQALHQAEGQSQAFELYAEELKLAQQALGRITGEVSADDLLGEIFSRFCVGK